MSSLVVKLENVEKCYQTKDQIISVLKSIFLEIHENDYIAITGPSGSGKTTLMHIIGFLDKPSSGKIFFHETEIEFSDDNALSFMRNKYIGFIFQSFHLLPKHDMVTNVALPLFYSGVEKKFRKEKAEEILSQVGLSHRRFHRPSELSGGEQQRAAIARALIHSPTLLLADEPTGNLDSDNERQILELFERQREERKITTVLVTHNPAIALRCKKQIKMRDGKIIEIL